MDAKQAYNSNIYLQYTCDQITISKWDELMGGAIKASGVKIRKMIKTQIPSLYKSLALNFHNPFEHQCKRTKTHLVYVHSGIEFFLKIN